MVVLRSANMTEQEAKDWLKILGMPFYNEDKRVEAIDMGIDALEKQISKKPIGISVNEDNMRVANCPNCKKFIVQQESPVGCKHCLQALDWGNEDAE